MNNKLRLLKLLNIFIKYTDENNLISMNDIILKLDFDVDRKSIYNDIKILNEFGYEIKCIKGKVMKYYLTNHNFNIVELKILYDLINSLDFISKDTVDILSSKLFSNASIFQEKSIIKSSIKTNKKQNKNDIINIINIIQKAINNNMIISFNYFDIDLKNNKLYRKNNKRYKLSPYSLVLINNKYYCIFYDDKYKNFSNYRIDKMDNLIIENKSIEKPFLDINDYILKSFNMFSGKVENITIQFDNSILNSVLEKSGIDIIILNSNDKYFTANISTTISDSFLSWIMQFTSKAKIIAPNYLIEKFKNNLDNIRKLYD